MSRLKSKQILFAGQAPVHFLCFRPIYERLRRVPGLTIHLSGEPKISKSKNGNSNGNAGANAGTGADTYELYRPFRVPKESVLPLDQALRGSYTMVFCAHMSGYFPRRDEERVQLFHGLSFRNMGIRRDVLIYDHLFITGPYMMRTFQKARLFRPGDGRCLPIGFPKVDRLVNGTLDRKSILRRLGFSGRRPVLLYAPTGQRQNSLETIGEEVLRRLRAGGRYDILLKLHDHPKDKTIDWPRRLRPLLDTHTRVIRDYDIVPYLFVSDLLITDASSVSSEYAILDRPMVFIDVPELLANVKGKAVAMDLDTWGRRGGVTARWPDEVVEAVKWSLAHPQDAGEVRRAMAEDLFYAPGQATDAAVQWILKKLDLPQVAGLPQKVRAQKIQARKVKVPGRASAGTAQ